MLTVVIYPVHEPHVEWSFQKKACLGTPAISDSVNDIKFNFLFFNLCRANAKGKTLHVNIYIRPQHLREQLLQNGKNNLILKNLQMQAMAAGLVPMGAPVGLVPAVSIRSLV